jgi:hypothetical protein
MRFPDGYSVGGISFITPRQGWIEASGPHLIPGASSFLFVTRDGGATWHPLPPPGFDDGPVFTGRRTGWGTWAQDPTRLFRSADAGRRWHRARLMIPARYRSQQDPVFGLPRFFNASDGIEEAGFPRPTRSLGLYTTTDAGVTWSLARTVQGPFNGGDFVPPASFLDRRHWTVFSSIAMYRTSNAGGSWTKATLTPAMRGVFQTDFPTMNEGWALVRGGTCLGFKSNCYQWSRLFMTRDGGASWNLVPIPRVR